MPVTYTVNKKGHCRLCLDVDEKDTLVSCDGCDRWFHLSCVGLKKAPAEREEWQCPRCREILVRLHKAEKELKTRSSSSEMETSMTRMLDSQRESIDLQMRAMEKLLNAIDVKKEIGGEGTSSVNVTPEE